MKKLYLLSTLMLVMMVVILPQNVKAQISVWDGTSVAWNHGNGTQSNPYLIESAQNLAWLAEMVSGGVSTYANMHFRLTTDINLNSLSWTPIGISETNCFKGTFDGDDYFIDNITVSYGTNRGLFGVIGAGATLKNIGVNVQMSFSFSGDVNVGGIVAMSVDSNITIRNCHTYGSINTTGTGVRQLGGMIGDGNGSSVENCSNNCAIIGNSNGAVTIGGIIGFAQGYNLINKCTNNGNITGNGMTGSGSFSPFCGGCIGKTKLGSRTFVKNFRNNGNIYVVMSYGDNNYAGQASAGGVIGRNIAACEIKHCFNTGTISTGYTTWHSNDVYIAAGIVSSTMNYKTTICNCYNIGSIQSKNYARGIGGDTIINCYNTGTLIGTSKYGIGGSTNTVTNSYYLETCGGDGAGTPKTEAAMKAASFPIILNADSVVYTMDVLNVNQGYPIFASEIYVLTDTAESISFTSATLKGLYSGNANVFGFEYKRASDNYYTTVYCGSNQPYAYQLTGLQSGTTYQYRYFVQKNDLSYYGEVKSFTTTACDMQVTIYVPAGMHCAGDNFTVTASAQSQYSNQFTYQWSNGATGSTMSPTESGFYTVTATASNGCSQSQSTSIMMYPSPLGVITGDTLLCAGGTATLTASGASTYLWSTGATTASINVSNPGTYSCTFTNEYGCTSTSNIQVTSFATTIAGTPHICSGQSTILTASPADSYMWSTGDQTSSITVSETGVYTVTAYHGNCSATASISVTAAALPTPVISGSTQFCEGQSGTLTASGGTSYLWSTGQTQPSISVNQGGTYSVTVTNADGCSASAETTVTTIPAPAIVISGNTNLCQGGSTILTASGADSYLWSTGATTSFIQVNTFGIYNVTGTSSNGCVGHGTVTVFVSPVPNVLISGNTDICQGETAVLTATGASTYLWSNGTENAVLSTSTAGSYSVIGLDENGCMGNASVIVSVWQPTSSEFTITTNGSYIWNGITYTQTGDYTQPLQTIHGCDSIVTLHLTIMVGVCDYDGNAIVVYPNPASDIVYVQCPQGENESNLKLQVTDAYGRLLQQLPVVREVMQIDFSRFAEGIYFVRFMQGEFPVVVRKVIKARY